MTAENRQFRFDPESAMWKVNGYKGTALGGGGRALHMQIAHPLVAQALDDSGFLKHDPYHRLKGTMDAGIDLIYGTHKSAQKVADRINGMHQHVHGTLEQTTGAHQKGHPYDAMDQKLLAWVGATLIDSSITGYEMFINDLSSDDKDEYLNNAKDLFTMVHLEPTALPSYYEGLKEYIQDMINTEQVKVGPLAKELAPYTTLSHTKLSGVAMYGLRRITVYALPEDLQKQFGYTMPDWERKLIRNLAGFTKKTVPLMPPYMRYFKQFREAQRVFEAK